MTRNALRFTIALLLAAACHTASAEEWICSLWEPQPSKSSFDYDIKLDGSTSARVEVSPAQPGVIPRDDAEAGTMQLLILQDSPDGLVLAGGGTGPTQYGHAAYGTMLVLNRQTKNAALSYALEGEKAGFINPSRAGTCTPVRR